MNELKKRGKFLRMFGSAIIVQALLSATSFLVGLILIRRTSETQYGYYVLVNNALLLMSILQLAFIQPYLVVRLTTYDAAQRADMIGGLYLDQRRLLAMGGAVAMVCIIVLRLTGIIDTTTLLLLAAATAASAGNLFREFLRMVLLAYRKPVEVLKADFLYVVLLVLGVFLATLAPNTATVATLSLALAAAAGGGLLLKYAWRNDPWNKQAAHGILRKVGNLGAWAASGAAIHWLFSQGYNYLIAGTLDVTAVAAVAATRIPIMPINLVSSGIGSLMLPTTSTWLQQHSGMLVYRRLVLIAFMLATAAVCYFSALWLLRDWIFVHLFKKSFAQRDSLLLLWSIVAVAMVFRDQLIYLLTARSRFRLLWGLTLASALTSLVVSYTAMRRIGVTGALFGILAGELINVAGIIGFSFAEARSARVPRATEINQPNPG